MDPSDETDKNKKLTDVRLLDIMGTDCSCLSSIIISTSQ